MSKDRISAIVLGSFLILAGIFGAALTGKFFLFKKNSISEPASRSGNYQVFFSSLGAILIGLFMLVFGIWGD